MRFVYDLGIALSLAAASFVECYDKARAHARGFMLTPSTTASYGSIVKRVTPILCLIVLTPGVCLGQQQTVFGSEMEIERPVKVPGRFVSLLSRDDRQRLSECQTGEYAADLRKEHILDHFLASNMDVRNASGNLQLMIVQANSLCFWGAHNTHLWVLAKSKNAPATSYKMIFDGQMDWLEVAAKAVNIYPDVTVINHTAVEYFKSVMSYSRGEYRVKSCYAFPMGEDPPTRKIRCSKYNWEFRQ